jgi:excisionase family DNA binding protein
MKRRPTVFTAHEIAEILRIHPTTVYRLVASGELHPYRVGRSLRFDQTEIEALVFPKARRRPRF